MQWENRENIVTVNVVRCNTGLFAKDRLSCGRAHLTCHVLIAMTCLGAVAEKELRFLEPWKDTDRMVKWLKERDWDGTGSALDRTEFGNEIMNVGNMIQYARDFHNDAALGDGEGLQFIKCPGYQFLYKWR